MTLATRSIAMTVATIVALGCAAASPPMRGGNVAPIVGASFRPVALLTFAPHFDVVGSHGRIVGRLRAPDPAYQQVSLGGRGGFTYVLDFQVAATKVFVGGGPIVWKRPVYVPSRAAGVRVIYFHPGNLRTAFSAPETFLSTEAVATEDVRLTIEFSGGIGEVVLRATTHRKSSHRVDYGGTIVAPPGDSDGSFKLYGRYSPAYGGFLLASTE
jgi:hypothetical protein